MKWTAVAFVASLAVIPAAVPAQNYTWLPIGHIAYVADRSPAMWGMSGMEMLRLSRSIGSVTPIMRTEMFDARLVEILSRTQAPPLRSRDIRVVSRNGRDFIAVRRYLLLEVMRADAQAERTTTAKLARRWAARVRTVLPQVAPMPNRFGV